ncbi:protein of unknown function [uncultured Sphingopyxis sp.]|uniref:Uncharacterized protein n=1 Tax=uncultured Sphingopyxis sp. TaxID=310581 RepID=A0A1Y5PTW3_9SPHN|nr:protein of unknown function [uncultured Sphingopyxis sp.]
MPRRPFFDQDPERETVLLDTVALHPLALHLAGAADGGGVLAGTLFAGLLVMTAQLHFAIHALTLQLLLERAKGLVDIIVANDDLHMPCRLLFVRTVRVTGASGPP